LGVPHHHLIVLPLRACGVLLHSLSLDATLSKL
jgi:hypothetical protein